MVLPVLPLIAGGALASIGGGLMSSFFGKKEATLTEQHAPYETYAPQTVFAPQTEQVYAPQTDYSVIIESPGATVTSKKESTIAQEQRADISPEQTLEQTRAVGTSAGTDFTKIAIIGVIGLIAYGAVSK